MILNLKSKLIKVKRYILFTISILVLVAVNCFAFSYYSEDTNASFTITKNQAIEYLTESIRSHQQVVDHPEMLDGVDTGLMGDLAFHTEWAKRYQEIKQFIENSNEKVSN